MLKYNLKGFFKGRVLQDDEWISNGHFLFNKSIITKPQRNMLDKIKSEEIDGLMSIYNKAKDFHNNNKDRQQFVPARVTFGETNLLHDHGVDLSLNEEYYNFFTKRGCEIYKGENSIYPTVIVKNNEVVGVLLPVKFRSTAKKMLDYSEYIESKVS